MAAWCLFWHLLLLLLLLVLFFVAVAMYATRSSGVGLGGSDVQLRKGTNSLVFTVMLHLRLRCAVAVETRGVLQML